MYRGFKKDAAAIAAQIREELELSPQSPLDPWQLARHLDIPVWSLSSYPADVAAAVQLLRDHDPSTFSGMLAFHGLRRVIIYNDGHAETRQRADIAHELAHALLLHRPHRSPNGGRPKYDQEQEDEAGWLGGVLLVTDEYCMHCCWNGLTTSEAALRIGVSQQLMQWRINKTGAQLRVNRARRSTRR